MLSLILIITGIVRLDHSFCKDPVSRNRKQKGAWQMIKEYEKPKVERIEFDYSETITTSGGGRCVIRGISVSWNNTGNACTNQVAGDQ